MREKMFLESVHVHALKMIVFLIAAALMVSGCSSSSDSPGIFVPPERQSTVETSRDDKGVWFVTGAQEDKLYDVFEAVGYAVATDRLWQAETFRRTGRGKLAEIFGSSQLPQDILVRTIGYSDQELESGFASLDQGSRDVINGYVTGFNRRIAEIRNDTNLLPYEFIALGMTAEDIENWTYKDVLAWAVMMLRNFDPEALETGQIENGALYQSLLSAYGTVEGTRMFEDLRWLNDPDALTYIHKPISVSAAVVSAAPAVKKKTALMENPASFPDLRKTAEDIVNTNTEIKNNLKKINAHVQMGSYAWAVSGSKTSTGNPMIYSGPQMGFSVPSIIGEGSIRAGGLNVSGMHVAGVPGIVIGRTPHHAWSMQVGHAHTVDYYLESAGDVMLHREESIKVKGDPAGHTFNVYRSSRGPIINQSPLISWKYSHWGYEFEVVRAFLAIARATSMDEFGAGIELMPLSQHFTYIDRDGNIAYWMSGRDPVRPYGEWRLPQGATGTSLEWDSANLIPRSTHRNASKGFYGGWNNKTRPDYGNSWNNLGYSFGVFHRAHVVDDYLSQNNNLTFDDVRELALNIATTDSLGAGGNPWKFVSGYFTAAVNNAPDAPVAVRTEALALMDAWDGHFVDGGPSFWATGDKRADAWVLMDNWITEVLSLTFEELDAMPGSAKNDRVLFNVFLHGIRPGGIGNYYNWFQNLSNPTAPQTADEIIVKALDNVLTILGARPWNVDRSVINYNHTLIGQVHQMPFSSRSTYAHVVEYGAAGPVKINSMFPLGESGTLWGPGDFDAHFFSMAPIYDLFIHRDFPLFTP
ncbi:MAG: penicillin acylase family protein [Smithella sp.]|jgi:penicillin amidase|nr:penicillin acylase family protein [Smithella sp.]